jgi:hypothetical protein
MGHYDFKKDLAAEKIMTDRVCDYFNDNNMNVIERNNTKHYDLIVQVDSSQITKFELKEDLKCEETGNVAVEYLCRGKPSGYQVTTAEYYFYLIHTPDKDEKAVIIKTETLKNSLRGGKYKVKSGGDPGSKTKMFVIPYEEFISPSFGGSVLNNWN